MGLNEHDDEHQHEYRELLEGGYGWRARIGFLSPGLVDETVTRQFYRMAPPGVTMVRTSLGVTFPVVDLIEPLESELRTTVVSSMQATLWKGLRMAGVTDVTIGGYGRLLRTALSA